MSDLIVMTFDSQTEARNVRQVLREGERAGHIRLDDAAVIIKDADGTIRVDNEIDRGVKVGAVGGGLLGLVLNFLFPIAGLVIGAAGGALVGRMLDLGVDQQFVQDVSASLQPNSSALFLIVRDADLTIVRSMLEPYRGTLHHTTFDPHVEDELRRALQ